MTTEFKISDVPGITLSSKILDIRKESGLDSYHYKNFEKDFIHIIIENSGINPFLRDECHWSICVIRSKDNLPRNPESVNGHLVFYITKEDDIVSCSIEEKCDQLEENEEYLPGLWLNLIFRDATNGNFYTLVSLLREYPNSWSDTVSGVCH